MNSLSSFLTNKRGENADNPINKHKLPIGGQMVGNFVDLAVSLFFLTALIFTAKSKSHISEGNSEAYKYISFGLSILSLSSVSHLCFYQGFFDSFPFNNLI